MFANFNDAKAAGEKYYFTGRPCKHGHVCRRYTCNKACIICNVERPKRRYHSEPEYTAKVLENCKEYRDRNLEECRERSRKYHHERYANDPSFREAMRIRKREWRRRKRVSDPEWKARENKKKVAREKRQYASDPVFRAKKNATTARWQKKKRKTDPLFRLGKNMAGSIWQSLLVRGLSKRRRHWEDLVGFTLQQLKEHIEPQFQSGMTWENYGPVWHIDHIKPLTKCESFEEAWQLSNLQPLFARDNIIKGNKWEPATPALAA